MKTDNTEPTEKGAALDSAVPIGFKIINWIGIIEQLTSTRMRHLLSETDVPPPQFVLLNHFSHRPEEGRTVSKIAWAMQQPQPGITKTISKLLDKQYLREEPHPEDGRSKILYITEKGKQAHLQARRLLIEGMGDTFDSWSEADADRLFSYLDELKTYFDEKRL
jgi:DNA-binding MarR family transcriptional regulator